MQRQFRLMIAVTAVAGAMSITGAPQGTSMQAVPDAGLEPGDTFVVSNVDGSECRDGQVTGDTDLRPGQWVATMAADGDWSANLSVPESGPPDPMGNPTPFPPGTYEIRAYCDPPDLAGFGAPAQQATFDYDPITVTVVAAQEPPPAEQPTPTSAPATPPPAAAAAAVEPTYTG